MQEDSLFRILIKRRGNSNPLAEAERMLATQSPQPTPPVVIISPSSIPTCTSSASLVVSVQVQDVLAVTNTVRANGVVFTSNLATSFNLDVPLNAGPNTIEIVSVNSAGLSASPITLSTFQNNVAPVIGYSGLWDASVNYVNTPAIRPISRSVPWLQAFGPRFFKTGRQLRQARVRVFEPMANSRLARIISIFKP
jgi:hypothetical protein